MMIEMMIIAQIVETSLTVNNCPIHYPHPVHIPLQLILPQFARNEDTF